jgi:hypothetical protein
MHEGGTYMTLDIPSAESPSSYEVRLDVTGTPGIPGELYLAATVFLPRDLRAEVPLIVAFPGGLYSRHYYSIDKLPGYSQAAFHTQKGAVFVAIDHLGVGESSQPDPFLLSLETLAAANHLAVVRLLAELKDGSLLGGVAYVPNAVIGVGQSMAGCILTIQQANHRTFDGVAFLGWSSLWENYPSPNGDRSIFSPPPRGTDLRDFNDYKGPDEEQYRFSFHWPDEPLELGEADMKSLLYRPEAGAPFTRRALRGDAETPWGSPTIPPVAVTITNKGVVASEAAAIDVPVFVGAGERDFLNDPWLESSGYRGSSDITLALVPKMAHMHNFAPTRAELWSHLGSFCSRVKARTERTFETSP